ncbi:MAG: energy transducer TonB [Erythrobacter sp.]
MADHALAQEERIGLAAAVLLHAALVAVLLTQAVRSEVLTFPERMDVSLVSEVGLDAGAREPVPESRMAIAPTLGEEMPPPAETPPQPRPTPTPTPAPAPRATQSPAPTPRASPSPAPAPRTASSPAPRPSPAPTTAARTGGSRVGEDFLSGMGSSTRTDETRAAASQIGASAKASIQQALARQVKPHWTAPQGLDVDQLVTLIDFDLNPDGSLKGRPRVRSQSGINDSNRAQAARHAENAIRAVQLAEPFNLPAEYYEAWKTVRGAQFDRNTSR